MRKLYNERKLFKEGNYMRKYGSYLHSLSSAGGTGTITISFNLVDDSNPDSIFQNCTGGPNTGQDDNYWTHWLSKFESSVGGFKFRHLVSNCIVNDILELIN